MTEKIQIFKSDKLNKLENEVNEFINRKEIVLMDSQFYVDAGIFYVAVSYRDFSNEEGVNPKDKSFYKLRHIKVDN